MESADKKNIYMIVEGDRMQTGEKKNNLGIFVFYDKDGIVDRYVLYLLEQLTPFLQDLIIMCNGKVNADGKAMLLRYTDKVFIRDNEGYDAMAVREAMLTHFGWERLQNFDSIVVFNDTFFGPFYPMNSVFEIIEKGIETLWGLLARIKGSTPSANTTLFGAFFYVMKRGLIKNRIWQKFWEELDGSKWGFGDAIQQYEYQLISVCEKAGEKWNCVWRSDRFTGCRRESNFDDYTNIAYELISYHKYPFLKRKPLSLKPNFAYSISDTQKRAIEYIARETDYDVSMIWENILRKYSWTEIKEALQLTKVLPVQLIDGNRVTKKAEAVLIFKVSKEDWLEDYIAQWGKMEFRIEVFPENEDIKAILHSRCKPINNVKIHNAGISAQYLISNLTINENCSCIFYMDDAVYNCIGEKDLVIGRTVQHYIFDGLLYNQIFVENVAQEFERDVWLGAMILPLMYHNKYLGTWREDEGDGTANVNAFWCARSLFPDVWEGQIREERDGMANLTDMVQKCGKFTYETLSSAMAEIHLSNMQVLAKKMLFQEYKSGLKIKSYLDLNYIGLYDFCSTCSEIYIYGAGIWGERIAEKLQEINIKYKAYLVSEGHKRFAIKKDHPVYEIKEIDVQGDGVGVIVAVGENQKRSVADSLYLLGIERLFFLT